MAGCRQKNRTSPLGLSQGKPTLKIIKMKEWHGKTHVILKIFDMEKLALTINQAVK